MGDLIERLRNYTKSFPDLADVEEAADEIERLRAVVGAANNLFCWGIGIEGKQSYVKITEQSWEPFEKALAALEDGDEP